MAATQRVGAESRAEQAASLAHAAAVDENLGRLEAGLSAGRSALALDVALGDVAAQARDLALIGLLEDDLGDERAALQDDTRAAHLAHASGARRTEGDALGNAGVVDMRLGNDDAALRAAVASLALARAAGNRVGEGDELGRIGLIDEARGRYAEALSRLEAALAVHRTISNLRGEAKTLNNIGIVDEHLGRYEAALEAHDAALPLFRSLGNRLGEAGDLGNLGIVYEDLGRYVDALQAHDQALAIARATQNRTGEAQDLGNLGIVDIDLGRYAEALREERDSLALDRAIPNPAGIANALGNIGTIQETQGDYEAALSSFQDALAAHRALSDERGEANDLGDIGVAAWQLGRFDIAFGAQQEALALDRELGNKLGESQDLNNIANLEQRAGHDGTALASARQAIALERALGARESLWRALRVAAASEAQLGRTSDALGDFDDALAQIETLRAGLSGREQRLAFVENKLFVYDEYIAYLRDLDRRFPNRGYDRKALNVFEREQGRAFLEEIGQSSARSFAGVPQALTASESELAATLARVDSNLTKARAEPEVDPAAIAALVRERAALVARSGTLERELAQKYPAYYGLTHPQPSDPAALQALLAPGQLMLVYSVLDDASALWLIDRERVQLFSLPGATALAAGVTAVLNGPLAMQNAVHLSGATGKTALTRIAEASLPGYERDAYALYRQLVPQSAQPALDAARSLLIVPTGPLYKLPFDILVTRDPALPGGPRYLLEEHDVTYLSSASLLAVLRSAESDRRQAPYPVLAFARPAFGGADPAGETRSAPSAAMLETHALASFAGNGPATVFGDLPNTEVEAKGVLSVLDPPAASEPLYEGDAASRANLMRLSEADCSKGPCLSDYRYLLFATHAVLPDQVAGLLQPSLVLAHPERGDGFVTMGDVLGLSLDADFVSLSACNTGGGTYVRGDGVRGLTQAFMYAGTPAVSVNMWELSDVAGSQISPAFYAGLKAGKSPAEALRDAKLAILHGPDPLLQQPYFWGPTVIFGDGARSASGKGT